VALRILREEGLEAVTMRRLAAELDTGPASLYVYIGGRAELRAALLDRVTSAIPLEKPDPIRWRAQLHALLSACLRVLAEHPGLAGVSVANPPVTPGPLRFAENLLGILLAGGVTPQDAAWACDILPLLTTACAVEGDVRRARGQTDARAQDATVERMRSAFSALPPSEFPLLTGMVSMLMSGDGDERFHFAIDVFVDGMVARAARAAG
jgi:AcrR family transcriptional regulator